jgi:putative phage-type endonuclease
MKFPIYHDMEQGSDEWSAVRMGKVTASRFKDAMAGGSGASKDTLMNDLLSDLDQIEDAEKESSYSNKYMKWGTETEAKARDEYEEQLGLEVKQVGFIELNEFVGVSPDGLVGDDGLIEIKCPKSSTHMKYRRKDKFPATYVKQVQGQLWVSGRKWCDFVSFDPRSKHSFWHIRVERDEDMIKKIEKEVNAFVELMKRELTRLNKSPF